MGNPQRSVEDVSWNDIVNKFLLTLNSLTGRTFALPTEAQWKFAARGGRESQHYKYSGSNNITILHGIGITMVVKHILCVLSDLMNLAFMIYER